MFLCLGIYTNPSLVEFAQNLVGTKPSPQIQFGSWNNDVSFVMNSTFVAACWVKTNYTIYGDDLSVGQPISVNVNVTTQATNWSNCPYIVSMSVEPQNTIKSPFIGDIGLSPRNNSIGQRFWSGTGLFEFNAAGPLIVSLYITALNNTGKFTTAILSNIIVPAIIIGPTGSAQIAFYANQNLSLTWFILFFASIDIALTLYDHSYEDVEATQAHTEPQHDRKDDECYCPY